jgi:hypothetical protein
LYQGNQTPSRLALLFLAFNIWQTIFTLNAIDINSSGIRIAQIILLNIFLSFLVFIISAEMKRYSIRWAWAGLATGVFQCLRMFFISATISGGQRLNIAASLLLSGVLLALSSVVSIDRGRKRLIAEGGRLAEEAANGLS